MSKTLLAYYTALILVFAYANMNGYVYSSFFSGQGTANKSANHYHK